MSRSAIKSTRIALWIKLAHTLFVLVLVPVYWIQYGPQNFFWASDIALLLTVVALWTESALLASMLAVAVLVPDLAWNIDFFIRLTFGVDALPLASTQYMFDRESPLLLRGLSLFHVYLPVLLVWLVYRLGYERRALIWQTVLAWVVLPATWLLTDPAANINFVRGFDGEPQSWMPAPAYLILVMMAFPLIVYMPTHFVLRALFAAPRPRRC